MLSDGRTVHDQLAELAAFTASPGADGVTREVFTPEYMAACDWLSGLMRDAGLSVSMDAFGNLFGRLEGSDADAAAVLLGSHVDTVPEGGRYDGAVGVLGAIEAVRALRADGWRPRRPIEVVCFAGEEPCFGKGCIGSRAMTGALTRPDLDVLRNLSGTSLADAVRGAGLDPARLDDARLDPRRVHAFIELHIEQGTVLESQRVPIGVVTHIAAQHSMRLTLRGQAAHAGATPMPLRCDALAGAAEMIVELERLARASPSGTSVATVGALDVLPGAINVVPGEATLTVDVRDRDLATREALVAGFATAVRSIASRRGLAHQLATIAHDEPVACTPAVVEAIERSCSELELEFIEMTSGAVHDAMILGRLVPIGMIFVPSKEGISHAPAEHTEPGEIDLGVRVLAGALNILADAA